VARCTEADLSPVNALLGAMTLPEKVGQMDQQLVDNLTGPANACGSQGWPQLNQSSMKTWLLGLLAVAVASACPPLLPQPAAASPSTRRWRARGLVAPLRVTCSW